MSTFSQRTIAIISFIALSALPLLSNAATTTSATIPTSAQVSADAAKVRADFLAKIQAARLKMETETKAQILNSKLGVKVKLDAEHKDAVQKILAAVFAKMTGALTRIGAFDKSVSAAIGADKAKGLDTKEAEALLQDARASLNTARIDVDGIKTGTSAAVGTTAGISKEALAAAVGRAADEVRAAKAKYAAAIAALPPKAPAPHPNADLNASTTAN